ncbi:hypothetical protein RvY_17345 [Ramazzottius varieornatus]|uniref:DUF659 domain-containing protein n=1 Tax=Ramazzottius varieornatus TaxID=947166 RepID=A0A1D1W8V6_RAMVA|nr:hypothetical protein RvY_17345 [Ramazzottius varieornatus]
MFDKEREELRTKLAQNDSGVAVTLDYWPSKLASLTITGTWVDADFVLHNGVLDFVQVSHPRTGEATFQVMKQTFLYYNIAQRVIAITTDNAANLGSARELLSNEFPNIFHVPCAAHVLHLTVRPGIDEMKTTIDKIRVVSRRAGREAAFQRFIEIQNEIYIDQTPVLIPIDVETRWNSTYDMLAFALTLREAVDQFTL